MKKELPKAYNPKEVEDKIYKKWEESGLFNPDTCIEQGFTDKTEKHFSIILPPPNVTGTLHLGHAMMLAIEDAMIRYKRMQGFDTLWIPGTDHAAIATQNVVEKKLLKEESKTRHDLGRKDFLKRVEEFVDQILRAEDVEEEWRAFYNEIRSEVWPDEFEKIGEKSRIRRRWKTIVDKAIEMNQVTLFQFLN